MTFHKLSFKIYCTNILNNRFYQATEVNLNRLKKKSVFLWMKCRQASLPKFRSCPQRALQNLFLVKPE